jgi:cobalt-precorrin 5A hydrolase
MSPRTCVVAISRRGASLARSLAASLTGDKTLYLERRLLDQGDEAEAFDLPLRPVIHWIFSQYQALVLFMPAGAAVRLLAPCLRDKHYDPAVVCVDDAGRFAISLLSGHLGGADRLAKEVAGILGATPVITSASHATGTLAVDLLGQESGWQLEAAPLAVTRASAAVVNGEPVGIYQEAGERDWWSQDRSLPENITVYPSLDALAASPCPVVLIITDRLSATSRESLDYRQALKDKIVILYRPRSLVVGMGCRRGVPAEELEQLLVDTFRKSNLSLDSLSCLATAELKNDEAGILALAEKYGVPLHFYSTEELNSIFQPQSSVSPFRKGGSGEDSAPGEEGRTPTPSTKAYSLLGLWGVSEPAALLASGTKELLVPRQKTARATIAVARKCFNCKLDIPQRHGDKRVK